MNACSIWNDQTGAIVVQDQFWVSGQDRAATRQELSFAAWDGELILLQTLTPDGKYLALERATGLHPLTVCEVLAQLPNIAGKVVAVLGRLDTTNEGKTLVQKGCGQTTDHRISELRVIDNPSPPRPQTRPWHLNRKTVREKLALVKSTTDLEYVRPSPTAAVFRCWAVVYGQIEARDSETAVVSNGNGVMFGIDPCGLQ